MVGFSLASMAQTPVYDSISMGPGYTNSVFYSMAAGTKTSAAVHSQADIQIRFEDRSASIRTLDGFGAKLYLPTNNAIANWATIDTTGMIEQFNSDTAWENGAYNATGGTHPNYGWGNYDAVTHDIIGTKVLVHKNAAGAYKKVWIVKLSSLSKTYYIRHANLDGSMDYTDTIGTADFPNKNFGYFNFATRSKVDAEPIGTEWDLVFRKYDRSSDNYPVAGTLSNLNVLTAQLYTTTPNTASGSGLPYYTNMSIIGWDWKLFTPPTGPWIVIDTVAYFILDQSNDIWRLVFTGFAGASTGKVYFTKTKVGSLNVGEESLVNNVQIASIYPNPAAPNSILAFTSKTAEELTISIFDGQGKLAFSEKMIPNQGLNVYNVGNKQLGNGMYIVSIEQQGQRQTTRMIVAD